MGAVAAPQERFPSAKREQELMRAAVVDARLREEILSIMVFEYLHYTACTWAAAEIYGALLAVISPFADPVFWEKEIRATAEAAALLAGSDPWEVAKRAAELFVALRRDVCGARTRWRATLSLLLEEFGGGEE